MRQEFIIWCYLIPGLQAYLFRLTLPDLQRNHLEGPSSFAALLAPLVEKKLVRMTGGQQPKIRFWNGSLITMGGAQHDKDVLKYQGAEMHLLGVDEAGQWPHGRYAYLRSRVRLGGFKVPDQYKHLFPRILLSANPGGVGHNWLKMGFVDNGPPMSITRMPKDEGGMLRQYIPASLADNPTMAEIDPEYADRLSGLGDPALVRAMLNGDWDIVAGGMFDDLWSRQHHVLEPFKIPAHGRVDRSFDWGSSKPFSVGWWWESNGEPVTLSDGTTRTFAPRTVVRIAEWYGWNGKPNEGSKLSDSEIAKGIVERETAMGIHGRVQPGPADSSIFDEVNGDSPALIQKRHGVRWLPADKSPGTRVRGWSVIRERLAEARKERPEGPGLFVFDRCSQFIRTVPVLPRDERNRDDVDTDAEDHIADEMRYRVLGVARHAGSQEFRVA